MAKNNDGLAVNAKGYEDSQSNPVIVFDVEMNEIHRFGSICECSKQLKIGKSTITRQCKGVTKTKPRCGYYFKFQD